MPIETADQPSLVWPSIPLVGLTLIGLCYWWGAGLPPETNGHAPALVQALHAGILHLPMPLMLVPALILGLASGLSAGTVVSNAIRAIPGVLLIAAPLLIPVIWDMGQALSQPSHYEQVSRALGGGATQPAWQPSYIIFLILPLAVPFILSVAGPIFFGAAAVSILVNAFVSLRNEDHRDWLIGRPLIEGPSNPAVERGSGGVIACFLLYLLVALF